MSILKQVIQQYGNPETLEGLTDRTDKRASVGFVSEWLEGFEKNLADVTPEEVSVAMEMVAITRMRLRGEVPDHYTATTICKGCGPVPIFDIDELYVVGEHKLIIACLCVRVWRRTELVQSVKIGRSKRTTISSPASMMASQAATVRLTSASPGMY